MGVAVAVGSITVIVSTSGHAEQQPALFYHRDEKSTCCSSYGEQYQEMPISGELSHKIAQSLGEVQYLLLRHREGV